MVAVEIVEQAVEPVIEEGKVKGKIVGRKPGLDPLQELQAVSGGEVQGIRSLLDASSEPFHLDRPGDVQPGRRDACRGDASCGPLGFDVERPDGIDHVSEEVDPERIRRRQGKEIDQAAPDCVLSRSFHHGQPSVADLMEEPREAVAVQGLSILDSQHVFP